MIFKTVDMDDMDDMDDVATIDNSATG